jgi:heme exporter protein B
MNAFLAVLGRDLRLACRGGAGAWMVLGFFAVGVAAFPLGIGAEPQLLARIAPGVLWAMALLSALLSFDALFEDDFRDGSLEPMLSGGLAAETLVLGKALSHWLVTGLPLCVAAPFLGFLLHLPGAGMPVLFVSLLLGTPALSLLGTLGAALALGARRATVLLALMVLPLAAPVLIFGAGAVDLAVSGLAAGSPLLILGGMALVALAVCPVAAAAALRQAME